jgi:hypothetical protein
VNLFDVLILDNNAKEFARSVKPWFASIWAGWF